MIKSNKFLFVYITFLLLVIVIGVQFFSLSEEALMQYDALHYLTVRNEGYHGIEVAFFPLFPFVWKALTVSPLGISIINAGIYFTSVYFLFRHFKFTNREKILALLTPGLVFFMVPYTEAFFFGTTSILLIGISKKDLRLITVGLFLSVICRPSFTVLLPALILIELFSQVPTGKWKRISIYCIVTVVGSFFVAWIQYVYTGKWFEYFSVQTVWDNHLSIPTLPLRSWGYEAVIMLDGVALLVGAISGIVLLISIMKRKTAELSDVLKLSLAYLGGMSLIVLLFRGGSLFSLNRFIFCCPFFFIVVGAFFRREIRVKTKMILVVFFLLLCYWLLFGSYVHIQTFLRYGALSMALLLVLLIKHPHHSVRNSAFCILYFGLLFVQLFFIYKYLTGNWVG